MYNTHPLCINSTTPVFNSSLLLDLSSSYNYSIFIRYIISFILVVITYIHILTTLPLFIIVHFNKQVPRIRVRSITLVVLPALAVLLQSSISFFPFVGNPSPSYIVRTCMFLIVAFSITPIPIRLFSFYGRYVFSRAITQINIYDGSETESVSNGKGGNQHNYNPDGTSNKNKNNNISSIVATTNENSSSKNLIDERDVRLSYDDDNKSITKTASVVIDMHGSAPTPSEAAEAVAAVNNSHHRSSSKHKIISSRELMFLKFISSPLAQVMAFILALIPMALAVMATFLTTPALSPAANCYGVKTSLLTVVVLALYGALAIGFGVKGGLMVKNFPDPFGLARETRLYSQYGGLITLSSFILDAFLSDELPVSFSFDYFVCIGLNIMYFTSNEYQLYLAVVEKNLSFSFKKLFALIQESVSSKKRIKTTKPTTIASVGDFKHFDAQQPEKSSSAQFMKMLSDPKETNEFEKYLVGEFSAENLRMYIECKKWEKMYYDATDSQRRARARKIQEHFVEIGSLFEINLPDEIRKEIKQKCENKDVPLTPDLFSRSQIEMLGIMYDAYQRYSLKRQSKT